MLGSPENLRLISLTSCNSTWEDGLPQRGSREARGRLEIGEISRHHNEFDLAGVAQEEVLRAIMGRPLPGLPVSLAAAAVIPAFRR